MIDNINFNISRLSIPIIIALIGAVLIIYSLLVLYFKNEDYAGLVLTFGIIFLLVAYEVQKERDKRENLRVKYPFIIKLSILL